MSFKGSLESINLADIFQNLTMNQQTGTLRVEDRDRGRMKCIYFIRGEIRYLSRGRGKNVLLGEMLVGRGMATREQVNAALAEQKRSGRLLGEIVVQLDICQQDLIEDLVRFQIEEEIYDLFSWDRGEFEFTEGPPPDDMFDPEQQATEVSIVTSGLIMEAARRIDEWERIRRVIPSMSEVFVPGIVPLGEDAPAVATRILAFLDGTRTVDAAVEDSYFSRFEVASTLVGMLEAGQVKNATAAELKAGAAACLEQNLPERAARLLEKTLSIDPGDPDIRERLAAALIAAGENEKAVIHLSVLGDERAAAGDPEGASSVYLELLGILPRHPATHEKLAKLRAAEGQKTKAAGHYVTLVQGLIEAGRLDEAVQNCRDGLTVDAENAELRSALAKVLLSLGDKQGAIGEFERLGEYFVRTSQRPPAAEVFRRILQIDPRNRHAKNRLNFIISGGAARSSHGLRNVAIALLVLLVIVASGLVFNELRVLNSYQKAADKSADLVESHDFEDARAVLRPVAEMFSIFGYSRQAEKEIAAVDAKEKIWREEVVTTVEDAVEKAKQNFEEGVTRADAHENEKAMKLFRELAALEFAPHERKAVAELDFAPEEMRAKARSRLAALEDEEREIDGFLAWKREITQRPGADSLREELRRTREILGKYPGRPRLKDVTRPLRIESVPTGARVIVGDVFTSPTPTIVRFRMGDAPRISLERRGYVTRYVEIPEEAQITVRLRRARAWSYDVRDKIRSLAAGPAGLLLVATQDGALAAIDAAGGKAWAPYQTEERLVGIVSGMAVHGDTVYFGTNRLYSLTADAKTRKDGWDVPVPLNAEIRGPLSVGKVELAMFHEWVFGTCVDKENVGYVWAVSAADGKLRWRTPLGRRRLARSRPFLQRERVYVTSDDGFVSAIHVARKNVVGEWSTGAKTTLTSIAWDERRSLAWVGTGDGRLLGLDLEDPGRPERVFTVGRGVATDIVLKGGTAYFGDASGSLHAVSLDTLGRPWQAFAGKGHVTGPPAVSDRRVYYATVVSAEGDRREGRVYAVDRLTGKLVWEDEIKHAIRGGLVFDGRYLYAAADENVYAYDENQLP